MTRLILIAALLVPGLARAQAGDTQTLADIRQDLQVMTVEMGRLKRELSTTGGPGVGSETGLSGTSALERIDAMEGELRRLTSRTEEIENRVNRVVADGTNRIGDLRFRVCEIEEGCDIAALEETPPLGGIELPDPAPAAPVTDGAQMAIGEQQDFDRAKDALDQGDFRAAADRFKSFTDSYTGGPLTGEAHFLRGRALAELGDDAAAARAYLDAFSGQPEGPRAAEALLALGVKLDALGQRDDACATLGEVPARFPGSAAAAEASEARSGMSCP